MRKARICRRVKGEERIEQREEKREERGEERGERRGERREEGEKSKVDIPGREPISCSM